MPQLAAAGYDMQELEVQCLSDATSEPCACILTRIGIRIGRIRPVLDHQFLHPLLRQTDKLLRSLLSFLNWSFSDIIAEGELNEMETRRIDPSCCAIVVLELREV